MTAASGVRARSSSRNPAGSAIQPPSLALTSGPTRAMSMVAPCFAFSAAITLPISLMLVAPVSPIAAATAASVAAASSWLRQEGFDQGDLRLLLRHQLRPVALLVQQHALPARFHHPAQHGQDFVVGDAVDALGAGGDVGVLQFRRDHAQRGHARGVAREHRRLQLAGKILAQRHRPLRKIPLYTMARLRVSRAGRNFPCENFGLRWEITSHIVPA